MDTVVHVCYRTASIGFLKYACASIGVGYTTWCMSYVRMPHLIRGVCLEEYLYMYHPYISAYRREHVFVGLCVSVRDDEGYCMRVEVGGTRGGASDLRSTTHYERTTAVALLRLVYTILAAHASDPLV